MTFHRGATTRLLPLIAFACAALSASAQSGNAGAVRGTVTDPSGAVIPKATVQLTDKVSGFDRTTTTDATGQFSFSNVPFNPYMIDASAKGFASFSQNVEIRSSVGITVNLILQIAGASQTVTVESGSDLIENDSTFHTDVDRDMFTKVPLESQSSGLSALVTQTTPGVSADSNGLFHGLGDHASNSFSVDGQSITDQQSKVFSNQLPSNSIQSIEVISGAPPAEYGDKTSLVIVATTRSGQGVTTPTGSAYSSYGSFGSASGGVDLSYGRNKWGNFIEADGLNTGRFLDPPEFTVFHDKGNEENFFDRVDYSLSQADSVHFDLNYSRSWFQTPNSYDNLNVQNVTNGGTGASPAFGSVGNADQHSKIGTYNISPTYTRIISSNSVFNLGVFVRRDGYDYYPSANPLADLGPSNLQTSSISQYRTLTNAGIHADYSYVKGVNNLKVGAQYEQTFLRENDSLGIVEATYNSPCIDLNGNRVPGFSSTSQCASAGYLSNDPSATYAYGSGTFNPLLELYDLTRGGTFYDYSGHSDIKEMALYAEDEIKAGHWDFNLGLREDLYNGLTDANQTEPRLGIAYNIKPSGTVASISYARTLETPFNENLVLSSEGCGNPVLSPLLNCTSGVSSTMRPGFRNEFHAGLQQALGKNVVFSGEYIWKYTQRGFDFSILGDSPITFPVEWTKSKIPGYAVRASVPNIHGVTAFVVFSSVAARFFEPQVAGVGSAPGSLCATTPTGCEVFRIDHDEHFNQTTHLQYQPFKRGPWVGFNWRYDSGLVAGPLPCAGGNCANGPNGSDSVVDASIITPDQQFQAGLSCNGVFATPTTPISPGSICPASEYKSSLVKIPAAGTENDDHNPPRIAPRNLFDLSVGQDDLFRGLFKSDKYKWSLRLSAINLANKEALYNFISTFSGTHYVTPRALTVELGFHF